MPSPFPGMDPYLEGTRWSALHYTLGAEIIRQLAPRLRPRYVALPVERLVADSLGDIGIAAATLYPDVSIIPARPDAPNTSPGVVMDAPLQLVTAIPDEVPSVSIEVRAAESQTLVTAIEILSPANKRGDGRAEYLAKRRRLLTSDAHLIEIDLLREGARVPMRDPLPAAPAFVFLSRAGRRPVLDIWPIPLEHPLPTIPVPLLSGDADVPLDLQRALDDAYDLLGYDLIIDYTPPPPAALTDHEAAWADALLRERGLRPRR